MHRLSILVGTIAALSLAATSAPAQDFAARLNAPGVNLVSNVVNWQNTLQFGRLMQTSSYFPELLAPRSRLTVLAIENDTLAEIVPRSEINRIVGKRDKPAADRQIGGFILPGVYTVAMLRSKIVAGKGSASFNTLSGAMMTATLDDGAIVLVSADGSRMRIVSSDHRSRNGIVHIVEGVLAR